MKPRLPHRLIQALLAACAAALISTTPAFADIPEDYTQVVISSADELNQYSSSSPYAFLVEADIIAATHMYGEAQYWSSGNPTPLRVLTFSDVNSSSSGGAISSSTLNMEEFEELMFSSCTSSVSTTNYGGGAIYGKSSSGIIDISRNGAIEFAANHTYFSGGAILSNGEIVLDDNDSLSFDSNYASGSSGTTNQGGAIYSAKSLNVMANRSVTFSRNQASGDRTYTSYPSGSNTAYGGAIYGGSSSDITLSGNGSVVFTGNYASYAFTYAAPLPYICRTYSYGGAIYGDTGSNISIEGNDSVTFSGNYVTASSVYSSVYYSVYATPFSKGGAIYGGSSCNISLSGNVSVAFRENYASSASYNSSSDDITSISHGGAIYGDTSSIISIGGNDNVEFTGNYVSASSSAYGGAIYGDTSSSISIVGNDSVEFSGNYATSASLTARGGAIHGGNNSSISIEGNGSVAFRGNHASSSSNTFGSAIHGGSNSSISIEGNGSVEFSGNYATGYNSGGAIYGSNITLSGNGSVAFRRNYISYDPASDGHYGGAIYSMSGNVIIEGNDSVEFRGNYELTGSGSAATYRLISVYKVGYTLKLAAGEGQSISFYDSIYTSSAVTVSYNGKYVDSNGNEHAGTGDILMSGTHAEEDLLALKQNYTQSELDNSRLFEISGTASLYGGRLRVEDQAVYKGTGIEIAADSNAVLRLSNASLVLTDGITVGANAKIAGWQTNEISTSDGIDISETEMRGTEGMGTLSNVSVEIIDNYTIEDMSISGSVIDISEGTTLYVKHVNIEADARITDEAAWLDMVDTHGWLDNSNTEASAPVMSLGDTLFYRSGDDAWIRLNQDVSYVALTSELFSNVTITGSDLWLDLTGIADTIGDAHAFSIAFKDALYDVNGLRVVATVDGEHYLDGYYTTKQEGTTTTLYFSAQIPEPGTGTLSLLAFAALAARRRRTR